MIPDAKDFEIALTEELKLAQKTGLLFKIIVSGDLHRKVGGYPAKDGNHRMPICCDVMKKFMKSKDKILHAPLKGKGATLKIKYYLPRQ